MPVIKSANAPTTLSPFSMKDIEDAAKRILLRAQRQAEELLAAAQAEAGQLKLAAEEQGLAEGRQRGLASGMEDGKKAGHQQAINEYRERLTALTTALTAAMAQLDASRRDLEATALREVVDLATAIACRVTKRQAAIDPQVLCANLQEAMKLVVHASDVRIAVHPDQRKTLDEVLPRLRLQWPNLEHVELVDDATLSPGGCRLSTRHGQVSADLDGQLDRVIADLMPEPITGN